MTEELNMIYDELRDSNAGSVTHLENALLKIRAGKATPSMLSGVMVDYYGTPTPLQQIANVNTLDARTLSVQPWEKAVLDEVCRGIINANLGFAPQNNGELVIISVPPLTEERRKDLVKKAKSEAENAKVSIRNNRKEAIDMIKALKDDGLSEDMQKDGENEVQSITNEYSNKVDGLVSAKEADIMTI